MPLTESQVALLVAKYARERDRFQKMADFVQRHVQVALKNNLIRCVVTSRAKDPDSLGRKLISGHSEFDFDELQHEFNPSLLDVAGVRVMLYQFDRDNRRVVGLLEDVFVVPDFPRYRKDKGLDATRCYQARHRVVQLRNEHLADPAYENLKGLMCEIQVVSLVKHIWNELEHDVGYKDPENLGEADREQEAWLAVLWESLQAAETAVSHLSRVTDTRRAVSQEEERALQSSEDLRLALGLLLRRPIVGDIGALFKLLNLTEKLVSRKALRGMGLDRPSTLDDGHGRLGSVGLEHCDDVEAIVAHLSAERGQDFLEATSKWPGPKSKLRRTIEALQSPPPIGVETAPVSSEAADDRT